MRDQQRHDLLALRNDQSRARRRLQIPLIEQDEIVACTSVGPSSRPARGRCTAGRRQLATHRSHPARRVPSSRTAGGLPLLLHVRAVFWRALVSRVKGPQHARLVWLTAGPGRTSAKARFVLEKDRTGTDARDTTGAIEAYLDGPADLKAPEKANLIAVRADMSMIEARYSDTSRRNLSHLQLNLHPAGIAPVSCPPKQHRSRVRNVGLASV